MTTIHHDRLRDTANHIARTVMTIRTRLPAGLAGDEQARAVLSTAIVRAIRAPYSPFTVDIASLSLAAMVAKHAREDEVLWQGLADLTLLARHLAVDLRAIRECDPLAPAEAIRRELVRILRGALPAHVAPVPVADDPALIH